jgi:hypothetical protein
VTVKARQTRHGAAPWVGGAVGVDCAGEQCGALGDAVGQPPRTLLTAKLIPSACEVVP